MSNQCQCGRPAQGANGLPLPGEWIRLWHSCPHFAHYEPVEVTAVESFHRTDGSHGHRVKAQRCDGREIHVYNSAGRFEIVDRGSA